MNALLRSRMVGLAWLGQIHRAANGRADGFPSRKAYRHARRRQQIAAESRRRNRP